MTLVAADLVASARAALAEVRDPELDEPITDCGFVVSVEVDQGAVHVRLRLPTYWCAPNFAYLMVSDARDVLLAVPGIDVADVQLVDHCAADAINEGVAAAAGFVKSFPAEAAGELDDLRHTFQSKAHTASMERACHVLLQGTWTIEELPQARLSDVPEPERGALERRRRDLGLPLAETSLIFVDDEGTVIPAEQAPVRLRFARTVRRSIEGNGNFCRGLLTTRYPGSAADQAPRPIEIEETHR